VVSIAIVTVGYKFSNDLKEKHPTILKPYIKEKFAKLRCEWNSN